MQQHERLGLFDFVIGFLLIALIVLSPMPFGSAAPWAKSLAFLLSLAMVGLWLIKSVRAKRIRVFRTPMWFLMAAVLLLIGIQLLPMAPDLLKAVSPSTGALYEMTVPGYPASGEARTVSVDMHASLGTLTHWAMLAMIFFVVVNTVRSKGQVVALILALVAVGTFEALYGFAEQFSGGRNVFWNERQYHLSAVTGTFHNKNHFAGLLGMVVPLLLGLFIAASPKANRSPSMRARIVNAFSAAGTHRQVILGISLVLVTVAVFFSLSRAGIVCAVLSWAGFAIVLSMASGFRKYTLALLMFVALIICIATGIGAGMVISSIEDAASGQASSMADRIDLWQSALTMISSFPLLGTGLGTFEGAFEGFQSIRFGDRYADYLHNDWLQVFCELGVVGGTAVVAGIAWVMILLFRRTTRRQDRFCRWVAIGSMMGVCSMLLHSFFDYNLYKITSNGIIFTVILGLLSVSATIPLNGRTMKRPRYFDIPVRSPVLGCAMVILAAAAFWFPAARAAGTGLADIHFNRFLAGEEFRGRVSDYHFLEPGDGGDACPRESLQKAIELDPHNAEYCFYSSIACVKAAESVLRDKAVKTTRGLLGDDIETSDPAGFEKVVASLTESLKSRMGAECKPALTKAEECLREAISLSPHIARYHLNLSSVLAQLVAANSAAGDGSSSTEEAMKEAESAIVLAPGKPAVLFDAGKIFTAESFASGQSDPSGKAMSFAVSCFRRAMLSDSKYAEKVYALVPAAMGGREALIKVTPKTIPTYDKLIRELWEAGDWEDVLACLDVSKKLLLAPEGSGGGAGNTDALVARMPGIVAGDVEGTAFAGQSLRVKEKARDDVLLDLSSKRSCVLAILGKWAERTREVSSYSEYAQGSAAKTLARARMLRESGRHEESLEICLDLLNDFPKNQELLIEAADLASLPGLADIAPPCNRTIDLLFRLVINSTSLDNETLERILDTLDSLRLKDGRDLLAAGLVRGAGLVLTGRVDEGLSKLKGIMSGDAEMGASWRQRHLLWHYLGRGYEKKGEMAKAWDAYGKAVSIVPMHLESLKRLVRLEKQGMGTEQAGGPGDEGMPFEKRLDMLTPEIPCSVSFSGKVKLLGLTFSREENAKPGKDASWSIKYFWLFNDRMFENYHPIVHFCDENWRVVFQDDHRIQSMDRPYPVDFPCFGEVVVETRELSNDPTRTSYMRIGFVTPTPRKHGMKNFTCESGNPFFLTAVGEM